MVVIHLLTVDPCDGANNILTAKRKTKQEMKNGGKKIPFLFSRDMRGAIPKG